MRLQRHGCGALLLSRTVGTAGAYTVEFLNAETHDPVPDCPLCGAALREALAAGELDDEGEAA